MKIRLIHPLIFFLWCSLLLSSCKNSSEGDGVSVIDSTEGNLNSLEGLLLDFDEVGISTTYKKSISFYNKGTLTISDFTIDTSSLKDTPFSLVKNNCPKVIDSFTHCTVEFSFTSAEVDIFNAEIKLKYLSGIDEREKSLSLHAIAGTTATLEFETDVSSPFEQALIEPNSSRQLEYRVKNVGGLSARNISWDNLDSPFSFNGGDCGAKLLPQATCIVRVLYAPTSATVINTPPDLPTEVSTPLRVNYFNAIKSASLDNTIIGQVDWIEGRLRFYPRSSFTYGSKVITSSTTETFTVTNYGTARASNLNFSVPSEYTLVSSTCSGGLDPLNNCTVDIAFTPLTPSAALEDKLGEVTLNFQSGRGLKNAFNSLKLNGTGLAKAYFTFDPLLNDPDFGPVAVDDDRTRTFHIKNTGGYTATNFLLSISGDAIILNNTCWSLNIPGAQCDITVKFSPKAVGPRSANLNLSYNDGTASVSQSYSLSATGTAAAVIKQINDASFYNVVVGGSKNLKVIFQNIGIVPATNILFGTFLAPYDYVGGSFPGTVSSGPEAPCTDTLASKSSCQINLVFNPTDNQDYSDSITVDYFDQLIGTKLDPDINLSGHGAVVANLVFVDASNNPLVPPFDFGFQLAPGGQTMGTIKILNNGEMPASNIQADFLNDTAHLNYAFDSSDTSILFPGKDDNGNSASPCTNLAPRQICTAYFWFKPSSIGTFSDQLVVSYNNYTNDTTSLLDITGKGAAIGIMDAVGVDPVTKNFTLSPAAKGGYAITTLQLTNLGNGAATFTNTMLNMLDTTISRNTCTIVAAGATCEVDFKFAPTAEGLKVGDVKFTYDDGTKSVVYQLNLNAMGYLPIEVSITPSAGSPITYDFDMVEVGSTKTQQFSVVNLSSGLSIASLSFTAPTAPYSLLGTDCVAPLGPGQVCHFDLQFNPTVTGTFNNKVVFNFNNGVSALAKTNLLLTGKGETPTSTHNGWSKIYAIGDKDVLNKPTVNEKKIIIGWYAMTPKTGTITKYNIYRSTTSNGYNFSAAPYASTTSALVLSYTDTAISAGTVYYYTVRPVVTGFTSPSRTTQSFSELMVVAPPNNMAFLHRWAVNREVCGRLGFTLDSSQDFSCNYSGPGNTNSRFDFGTNMLIDRFELGANFTSKSGQKPAVNLSQMTAQSACAAASQNFTLNGRTATFVKRILTRKEFAAASLWPSTMTSAEITAAESGATSTVNCNSSGFTEATGTNSSCVSVFGLENMAGNEWEWVSDRVVNGVGITDDTLRIDANNKDLDNIDIGYTLTGSMFSQECFSIPMAHPFSKDAGVCQGTRTTTGLGEAYFHNNTFFSPGTNGLKGPVAGGSSYTAGTSGIFTTYWTNVNNYFGTRCGVAVP